MIQRLPVISLVLTMAVFAVLFIATSCKQPKQPEADRELEEKMKEIEELAEKRQDREKELTAMNIAQLARALQDESEKGVEPFNSMPYRELVSRGDKATPELKSLLTATTRTSFLGLLALRQMDSKLYGELDPSFRVSVLVDALKTSKYFNAWGLPHLYWEDAAKAIIAEGKVADRPLRALLDDQRAAPMWGSDEVLEYKNYNYRVKDYAWALLKAIRGEKVDIPTDPTARDKLISELLSQPQ